MHVLVRQAFWAAEIRNLGGIPGFDFDRLLFQITENLGIECLISEALHEHAWYSTQDAWFVLLPPMSPLWPVAEQVLPLVYLKAMDFVSASIPFCTAIHLNKMCYVPCILRSEVNDTDFLVHFEP